MLVERKIRSSRSRRGRKGLGAGTMTVIYVVTTGGTIEKAYSEELARSQT